ncbi:MAG: GMC family oxidoreductase N-terminal domain-containing protein [Acidimicrobiia bacterium]
MAQHDYDVLIVGSGFGGSVSAMRLTEKGYCVGVLESGKRWDAESLPKTNWDVRRFFWFPRVGMRGIQRISLLKDVMILSGSGVGGGSLVWANVSYRPHDAFYRDPQWGGITDWESELAPYYDQAERMLGVEENSVETNSDRVIKEVAAHFGVEETFRPTPVAVYFGEKNVEVPDPYFGGEGPTRTGCKQCGGCMVGCRFNAKNTLQSNYLYMAERHGADVLPQHLVTDVAPLPGGGYRVTTEKPGAWFRKRRRVFTADHVVFSAGALGTSKLLLRLKESSLPGLSDRLGYQFRTNSEAILGASASDTTIDYSEGVAITSSIHPEPHTHIEPVRYPVGSNSMGLLTTILVDGGGRAPRWVRFLAAAVRSPLKIIRAMDLRHWSERSLILLVMQSLDNSLRIFRKNGRFTTAPDQGRPTPTYIPVANEAARVAAEVMGGEPGSSINEALLDIPLTAHILGGAPIGETSERGAVDAYHRVFGYPGLHVIDGAAVGANLGVNPSLTITALAERAIANWPNRGDADARPELGESYERLDPVMPVTPIVPSSAIGAIGWGPST